MSNCVYGTGVIWEVFGWGWVEMFNYPTKINGWEHNIYITRLAEKEGSIGVLALKSDSKKWLDILGK